MFSVRVYFAIATLVKDQPEPKGLRETDANGECRYSTKGWSVDFRPPLDIARENVGLGRGHPGVLADLLHSKSERFIGVAYPAKL
jgi:hypothetical protein